MRCEGKLLFGSVAYQRASRAFGQSCERFGRKYEDVSVVRRATLGPNNPLARPDCTARDESFLVHGRLLVLLASQTPQFGGRDLVVCPAIVASDVQRFTSVDHVFHFRSVEAGERAHH